MDENNKNKILEILKPTYRDLIYAIIGGAFDRFGVNYVANKVMKRYSEMKTRENEELAKKFSEILEGYTLEKKVK